ncbi:MAG TPA: hypothetical protein PLN56_01645 [Methanoregulaceae archaeon]|nr:MAG: hypothetical protein IPI71_00700 [Methanolinea sp.]HON80953.1 hypothetical protein [Methanoregulaceae archaeon]HPD09691.1 hypothetical protein [Methanoregulaceae archaeon]
MEGFDLPIPSDDGGIGLNESRCAMALKEKITMYHSLLEVMDYIETTDMLFDEDLFSALNEPPQKPSKKLAQENASLFEPFSKTPPDKTAINASPGRPPAKKRGKKKQ